MMTLSCPLFAKVLPENFYCLISLSYTRSMPHCQTVDGIARPIFTLVKALSLSVLLRRQRRDSNPAHIPINA